MLLVLSSPDFTPLRSQIAELAISYRLPTMFIFKTYVEAGGLLSYGADLVATDRQAATHVVKILKGTKVGDIAIEQPNRFELVVNLKTAKTIGIEFTSSARNKIDVGTALWLALRCLLLPLWRTASSRRCIRVPNLV